VKRGSTAPWRVTYVWSNGVKGVASYSTRDLAELNADKIRRNAAHRDDVTVTVTVTHRDGVPA
jgi:hypothetical protein